MAELFIDRPYPTGPRPLGPEEDIIGRIERENRKRATAEAKKETPKSETHSERPQWDAD